METQIIILMNAVHQYYCTSLCVTNYYESSAVLLLYVIITKGAFGELVYNMSTAVAQFASLVHSYSPDIGH